MTRFAAAAPSGTRQWYGMGPWPDFPARVPHSQATFATPNGGSGPVPSRNGRSCSKAHFLQAFPALREPHAQAYPLLFATRRRSDMKAIGEPARDVQTADQDSMATLLRGYRFTVCERSD